MPRLYLVSCLHLAGGLVADLLRQVPGVRRA
jgi:hypothetical protein